MCTVSMWMGGCVCWGVVLVEENMRYLSRNFFKYFSSPPLFFFFFVHPANRYHHHQRHILMKLQTNLSCLVRKAERQQSSRNNRRARIIKLA